MSSLRELTQRAKQIRERYNQLNMADGHDTWTGLDYTAGYVGDVGDLMKIVMAKENKRRGDNVDGKLEHELGDNLWSLLVISDHYGIDLEIAFQKTMNELDARLKV